MTDKFEDLVGDKEKKKEESHKEEARNEAYPPYHSEPQYGYGAPPPIQQPYSGAPPPLPPGWVAQWDQNSQRYYYLEQATGRTQWELPQGGPPPLGGYGSYGGPASGPGGYGGPAPGYMAHSQYNEYTDDRGEVHKEYHSEEKKKSGHGGMLAAGAGGLAVGAIGGALVADALDDSDEEHHHEVYAAPPPQPGYEGYSEPPLEAPPPGEAGSISSSDKEDLEEAREEYREASSESDREEAREDYEEAYDEAYGD
ncbi:MAG: hypothetical protein LQ351_004335 [Letrouitia transgressa]|nr:MAG: hypothetical protein LQ351_004335 [Letrouitia transgressa]